MKTTLLSSLLVMLFACPMVAQNWVLSSFTLGFGDQRNFVYGNQTDRMFALAPGLTFNRDNINSYQQFASGHELATNLSFKAHYLNAASDAKWQRELRAGLDAHVGRRSSVSFRREVAVTEGTKQEVWYAQLEENELALSLDHLWRRTIKKLSFYTGIGASVGTAVGARVNESYTSQLVDTEIIGPLPDEYFVAESQSLNTSSSFFVRSHVPVGMEVRLGQLGISADYALGLGLNQVKRSSTLLGSSLFTLRLGLILA